MDEQTVETTLYSLAGTAPERPQRGERRSSDRYLSLLRVGALTVEGRRELCLIRNISAGGMMIRAYSAIQPGTPLLIELKQGESVAGTAQWAQDGLTGVTFDDQIDIFALLSPPGEAPRPRMPRIEVQCAAWVRQGADVYRTEVANISQGGMCVECSDEVAIDEEVIVTVPGLPPIAGVAKWRSADALGISFNRVLALSELMEWLKSREQFERRRAAG